MSASGAPQAAVVGFAVSDQLEFVFDTLDSTRKFQNIVQESRVSLVIGWDEEITVQIDGVADVLRGAEQTRLRECYFGVHPDGRERLAWNGIEHIRVKPTWFRYSDFSVDPPRIVEGNPLALP